MYSPRQHEPVDAKKYDPSANQWMREALDSRQTIEELKAQNDKLHRELFALNAKVNLVYECLGDLKIVDRVGDLMQRKIREQQHAQYARQNPPLAPTAVLSPRHRVKADARLDEGVICGSTAFHETAAYSSSYEGQVARDSFNRKNMFDAEQAQLRDKFDIFGQPKLPSPKNAPPLAAARRGGDAIDSLLSAGATEPPAQRPLQPQVAYGGGAVAASGGGPMHAMGSARGYGAHR